MVQASPNAVFYATSYHPIQAGSIDGTDIVLHDNAVHRALIASTTGLYDPTRDVKAEGDPYCTVFVGGLCSSTSESTLHEAMSKYGQIRRLRIVRNIVTGASKGYAFVEYENEKEMLKAYEGAHMSSVDEHTVLVDYNRQQLMPGWIPRRFGGGFGGRKESGQLRFGGRERPFRAPLRAIPHAELEKLGIPLPPEGNYLARYQIPAPPRRPAQNLDDHKHRRSYSASVPSGQVSDNRFRELKSSRRGSETSIAMLWSRESPPAEYRRGRDSEVGLPRDLREGGIHREGTRSSDMRRSSGRQHVGDRGRSFPESSQPEEQVRRGDELDHQECIYEKNRHKRGDGDDRGHKQSRKHSRHQEGYRYSQKSDSEDIEQDRGRPRKRDHR